jgi:hypothetical protein
MADEKRTTSHAKTVELSSPPNSLDRAQQLQAAYDRAQQAREPLERQRAPQARAADKSHAASLDLQHPPNKLDRASQNLNQQYYRPKSAQIQPTQDPTRTPHSGSQQVQNQKPQPELKPKDKELRNAVEGPLHQDAMKRDDAAAREYRNRADAVFSSKNRENQSELNNERDQNRDDRGR